MKREQTQSESEVQRACMALLKRHPKVGWVMRCNVDSRWRGYKGLPVGVTDAVGISKSGQFLAIEFKATKGELSPEQVQFIGMIHAFRGRAVCVRNVIELARWLEEL